MVSKKGAIYSTYYMTILETALIYLADAVVGENWVLQQDIVAFHIWKYVV